MSRLILEDRPSAGYIQDLQHPFEAVDRCRRRQIHRRGGLGVEDPETLRSVEEGRQRSGHVIGDVERVVFDGAQRHLAPGRERGHRDPVELLRIVGRGEEEDRIADGHILLVDPDGALHLDTRIRAEDQPPGFQALGIRAVPQVERQRYVLEPRLPGRDDMAEPRARSGRISRGGRDGAVQELRVPGLETKDGLARIPLARSAKIRDGNPPGSALELRECGQDPLPGPDPRQRGEVFPDLVGFGGEVGLESGIEPLLLRRQPVPTSTSRRPHSRQGKGDPNNRLSKSCSGAGHGEAPFTDQNARTAMEKDHPCTQGT
jgi:hypothetical protein